MGIEKLKSTDSLMVLGYKRCGPWYTGVCMHRKVEKHQFTVSDVIKNLALIRYHSQVKNHSIQCPIQPKSDLVEI